MNIINLLGTFIITSLSLLVLKPVASRVGLMDDPVPNSRKIHDTPTPLVGGLGIYLGTMFITFFIPEVLEQYGSLFLLSAMILLIGIIDDMRDISATTRMGSQAVAALLMCLLAGNQLLSLGNLLGTGEIPLGLLSIPVTLFATVGVINAVNMSDGIDGLSGGMVVIALASVGFMGYEAGNTTLSAFAAIVVFAVLAFLVLNFRLPYKRPAMIYLGDAGSTFLGFVVAWIMIESTQGAEAVMPPVLALWFLAVPLLDTVYLLIFRPLKGKSPLHPGKDHIHHRLIAHGLSPDRAVLLLYAMAAVIAIMGLAAYNLGVRESVLFITFLFLFALYAGAIHAVRLPARHQRQSS